MKSHVAWMAFILLWGATVALTAESAEVDQNLIINGDMEEDCGWKGYNCGMDTLPKVSEQSTNDKHGGNASWHIIIERKGPQDYPGVQSLTFSTETDKMYRVRFWYKTVKGAFSAMMRNGANDNYVSFTEESFGTQYGTMEKPVWVEFVGNYTEKEGGNHARLCFNSVSSGAEFYIDDVFVEEIDTSDEALMKGWKRLFPKQDYACWQKSPWENLEKRHFAPKQIEGCKAIRLVMGENEYESTSLVLTNLARAEEEYGVSIKDANVPMTLREAAWVVAYTGKEVNDALPLLDGKLRIPPGESREVWMTLCSQGVNPGDYMNRIEIRKKAATTSSVDIRVKVYPVALPDDKPLLTFYWDYLVPEWTGPELAKALVKDMKEHYVNTPVIHPYVVRIQLNPDGSLKTDHQALDETLDYLQALNPKFILLNFGAEIYWQTMPGFPDEKWKTIFRSWLTDLVGHLKERGYGYDRFAMYPYDESLRSFVLQMAKLIKEVDPKLMFYVNNCGETVEEVRNIAPYVDFWCPFLHDYLNVPPYGERLEVKKEAKRLLRKNDRYFGTYTNPVSGLPQLASPYRDYRLAVWRAWKEGMGGFGYWIYSYKTHWNSYKNEDGENWAVVYLANDKDLPAGVSKKELVITGKRWEATREGVEDYVYLHMLKKAVAQPVQGVSEQALAEAKKVLASSPEQVLEDRANTQLADEAKENVLKAIVRVSGKVPGR